MTGKVLIIEDDLEMCRLLEVDLRRRGFGVIWTPSADEAITRLQEEDFDVVLVDIHLPGMNGITLCKWVVDNRPDIPVVIMTAFGSIETAVAAIRAGAYDFITKPVDMDILAISITRAVHHRDLQVKVRMLRNADRNTHCFGQIIGESPPMRELFSQLSRIADTETSVLITGESGSGKGLAARALHDNSRRKSGPFITINCSALPDSLLESELFGHKRGAFTDAHTDRKGLFLEAQGGTLFLDEIGELPLVLQPKLLRAIEERRIRPVGGNEEIGFDVRLIAATNRDMESAVENNQFREDLFYRINVFQLEVPPLRARGTDILLLGRFFIGKFSQRLEKQVAGISEPTAEKLLTYPWPGNVRELSNAIEHAVALTSYEKLSVEDLPKKIRFYQSDHIIIGTHNPTELVSMEEVERRYILHVVKTAGGNQSIAARILGMDRKTLYRKLQRYGSISN